jgi:hypothetical protein
MNNWDVECDGVSDNTLHKNDEEDWIWNKGYNDATFAHHKSAKDAVTAACPSYDDPVSQCSSLATCLSATRAGNKDWDIKCDGVSDNTLHMNSPDEWIWKKGYNDATFDKHKTPYDAISKACPTYGDPSTACSSIDTCMSATRTGQNSKDWDVKCDGVSDNTLHMNSSNEWIWSKGYNDATFDKHPTADAAIRAACPTFSDPTAACDGIDTCMSATRTGPNTKDWVVECKGQSDNTLHMNSPTDWIWNKGYSPATIANHESPEAAINGACLRLMTPLMTVLVFHLVEV